MADATHDSAAAPDALPELVNAERALEGLLQVTRERQTITAAFKRALSKGPVGSERSPSAEAELARRRQLNDDLESIAKRLRALTPAFSAAVDDVDLAVRAVITRSAAGGLGNADRAAIQELYAGIAYFAAEVQQVPHQPIARTPSALRGLALRRARRAFRSIRVQMDAQWQQMQRGSQWASLAEAAQKDRQ